MADLDKRQSQIQEGAGLTESKLNTDFIDFLRKWSTPILLVIACVALAFMLYRKYDEYKARKFDEAWVEYQDAAKAENPSTLLAVAETHAGMEGIPLLARLQAGDIWRRASITGVAPGGKLDRAGKITNPEDLLNAEQRTQMLDKAAEQYKFVLTTAGESKLLALHSVPAHFRLAAIAETREKWDDAKAHYEKAQTIATSAGFPGLADAAKKRLDTLGDLKTTVRLYTDAEIVTRPVAPAIIPPPTGTFDPLPSPVAPPSLAPTIDFNAPIGVQPVAPPVPAPTDATPTPVPAPVPAPANPETPK